MNNNATHNRSSMLKKMRQVFSGHDEIVAAYLFGSYAEGHARSDSDIDIGLLLSDNSNVGAMYPVHIAEELEDAADTKREMDVRILNNGTLRFLHQVLKGRLLFCRDDKKGLISKPLLSTSILISSLFWIIMTGCAKRGCCMLDR